MASLALNDATDTVYEVLSKTDLTLADLDYRTRRGLAHESGKHAFHDSDPGPDQRAVHPGGGLDGRDGRRQCRAGLVVLEIFGTVVLSDTNGHHGPYAVV